jgi:hypothetical protein
MPPLSPIVLCPTNLDGLLEKKLTDFILVVEKKFCSMLVDKTQLRLSRMLDTVTRHGRSWTVY